MCKSQALSRPTRRLRSALRFARGACVAAPTPLAATGQARRQYYYECCYYYSYHSPQFYYHYCDYFSYCFRHQRYYDYCDHSSYDSHRCCYVSCYFYSQPSP